MGRNITTKHTEKIFQKALSCPLRQSASAASQLSALSFFWEHRESLVSSEPLGLVFDPEAQTRRELVAERLNVKDCGSLWLHIVPLFFIEVLTVPDNLGTKLNGYYKVQAVLQSLFYPYFSFGRLNYSMWMYINNSTIENIDLQAFFGINGSMPGV